MFKTIFLKELKDMLRDRRSIALLVLLPVLLMTALTFFYDKILAGPGEDEYTVAFAMGTDKSFIRSMKEVLPNIQIKEVQDLKEAVHNKDIDIGLRVDPNWKEHLKNEEVIDVETLYDPMSEQSSTALSIIENAFSNWESEVVATRLEAKNINKSFTHVFNLKDTPLKDGKNAIAAFMLGAIIPMIIPIAIVTGSYPAATELFAGEKERQTIESLLIAPIRPFQILFAKWSVVALTGIFTGILSIVILIIEMQFTENLRQGFAVLNSPIQFVVQSIVLILLFAMAMATLLSILSIFAKTVKEASTYITPVMGLLVLPMMVTFLMDDALQTALYAVPVFNLFLFVRDTFSEQITMGAYLLSLLSYLGMIVVLLPVAWKLFSNHKQMIGK